MNCIVLGDQSDIMKAIMPMLEHDGWTITGWNRNTPRKYLSRYFPQWDLLICAIGSVAPVGHWSTVTADEWEEAVYANCILPIRLLKECWHNHKPGASVCFLAGANPNRAGPNYSGYYTGKMALLKAIETIDAETPDAKFFALAPGIVFTKIHQPTYDSGIVNQGLEERKAVGGTPPEKIYAALKWCVNQPKAAVGGRNICASDVVTMEQLQHNPSKFKLRRVE
jgi:hypothetical protein